MILVLGLVAKQISDHSAEGLGEVAVPSYLAVLLLCTSSGSGWTSRHSVLIQAMPGSRAPS